MMMQVQTNKDVFEELENLVLICQDVPRASFMTLTGEKEVKFSLHFLFTLERETLKIK